MTTAASIVSATGAMRPQFGRDGTLFLLSDRAGAMQLWSRAGSGKETRLTTADRVGAYALSSDGLSVAFAADVGGDERWSLYVMPAQGGEARVVSQVPRRVHHLVGWSPDGTELLAFANLRDARFFDLLALPLDGDAPRMVLQQNGSGMKGVVLPSGAVVVAVHRDRLQHHHLLHIDTHGEVRTLTPDQPFALHDEPVGFGDSVLVLSNRGRDLAGVARYALDGTFDYLVEAGHEVSALTACGSGFAYELSRNGLAELHIVDDGGDRIVAGHPPGAVPSERGGQQLALAPDGTVAFALQQHAAPPGIYLATRGQAASEVIPPDMAGIDPDLLPVVEQVEYLSFDSLHIPAFLLRPRGGGQRPTIIDLHGGPEAQSRPHWSAWTVSLVAHGFNVLFPNVRGSTGYGCYFRSLDDRRLRMNAVRDVDAAAAWLIEQRIAAARGVGVMGGSYGGYLALSAGVFFPERWAAIASLYGVSDYVAQFGQLPAWRRPLREIEFGSLEHDCDFLASISPGNYLSRLEASLLVVHGANDSLVGIAQAERVVEPLRERGHDVTYIRYEDEGHGIVHRHNIADAVNRIVEFFESRINV